MPERRLDVERVAAALAEAEAVAILHRLNADYVSAFARSDTAWCSEHMGEDFVCTARSSPRPHTGTCWLGRGRNSDETEVQTDRDRLRRVRVVRCDRLWRRRGPGDERELSAPPACGLPQRRGAGRGEPEPSPTTQGRFGLVESRELGPLDRLGRLKLS
jgi:hypothetical protein